MRRSNRMLRIIFTIALVAVVACIINVFLVTLFAYHFRSNTKFDDYVQNVSLVSETIYAKRGNIYDANGEIVAQDEKTYNIVCYLNPNRKTGNIIQYVDDPFYTSQILSAYLDMDQAEVYNYLTRNPNLYQTELGIKGRGLSKETCDAILQTPNIHGIGFIESNKRVYNQNADFAPYLIGFAQADDNGKLVGKMGLEYYLDEELNGVDGLHIYQRDKNGYILEGMYEETTLASNGYEVYTTIDTSVQQALDTAFDEVVSQNGASKAWGTVIEIDTGKIKAWGQYPGFNPNVLDIEEYKNMGSQIPYEPGSVMKAIIYATAMDIGNYNGETEFDSSAFCYLSNGPHPYRTYEKDNYGCIANAEGHDWGNISLDYGLIYSSNVATSTLLTDYVGVDNFEEYIEKFGFFNYVDSDGIAEAKGIKNYTYPSEKLALTYGQGSSVTMLQLCQAYTAIFGNGEMLKPYFIDKIVDSDNNRIIYQGKKTVVSKPIKESTAKQMQELLGRVVSDKSGTARFYAVDEVNIIAKTGTSEIVKGSGYNSEDSITSVMLAFPAEQPKYMIYFAYISPYDYLNHTYSTPIKDLIKRTAILTEVGYNPDENLINNTIKKYEMPNLVNNNYTKAYELLNDEMNLNVIKIGDGDRVYRQYPEPGDNIYTNSKVFLLTDTNNIILPDFSGWTRKDVIAYWKLSNVPFTLNGYGIVEAQSLSPGSSVNKDSEVIISFSSIESNIDTSIKEKEVKEEDKLASDDNSGE